MCSSKEKTMFPINDQFSAATKANFDAQLSAFSALTAKAFDSAEKIMELNISATRASLEESTATAKQLLAAKDPQEFFSLSAAQAQPAVAKAVAYSRHLASIASEAQAEFTRAAEEQIVQTGRRVSELVDDVSKNAPAGSENVIAVFKSAIGNMNAGYEQLSKSTKQAAKAMEANLNSAANQMVQAAEKTAASTRAHK
jgi:phasin family protein